jgi:hypothetical protein
VSSWSQEFALPEIIEMEGKALESIRDKSQISHRLLVLQSSETMLDSDAMQE